MASGEVATVAPAAVGRAAAGFRRNDQRPDLRCHRARRLSVTLPVPGQGPGRSRRRAEVRLARGARPASRSTSATSVRTPRPPRARCWPRCRRPTTRCCWRFRRTSARSRWSTARGQGPRHRGVRAARSLGGRRVVQRGQPDGRLDQRRPGAQRGRLAALSPVALGTRAARICM